MIQVTPFTSSATLLAILRAILLLFPFRLRLLPFTDDYDALLLFRV